MKRPSVERDARERSFVVHALACPSSAAPDDPDTLKRGQQTRIPNQRGGRKATVAVRNPKETRRGRRELHQKILHERFTPNALILQEPLLSSFLEIRWPQESFGVVRPSLGAPLHCAQGRAHYTSGSSTADRRTEATPTFIISKLERSSP